MSKKNVVIVGAGIGGLATALRLAKKGYRVEIVEKYRQPGGRLNQIQKDGFTFDTGPSFFSMSYEFEAFAKECNIELPFEYTPLDPLYSVNFSHNPKNYLLYRDMEKLAGQFREEESDFESRMHRYLKKSRKIFTNTVDIVIKNNFDSVFHYLLTLMRVNPVHLPVLTRSFWKQVTRYFSSAEARQIISLVAFFLGKTPFNTMAVYTLLSYTEFQHDGYYNVKGGMYKIVQGLVNELKKENVKITCNTEIIDFGAKNGSLEFLVDQTGQKWVPDMVVVNADAAFFRGKVFKRRAFSEKKLEKMDWTMGYVTFYLGLACKLPQVNHHSYFLGSNYRHYANKVYHYTGIFEKPYYYVNVVSKHNVGCAPGGCESLFFVCPVPNLLYKTNWDDKNRMVNSIINDFSKRIGKNIRPQIISKTIYTPQEWQNRFNLYKGSGLGLSHSLWQIGALRPKNHDEQYDNVFYVGASTVPGAGLPMAIISSKLAVERIEKQNLKSQKTSAK